MPKMENEYEDLSVADDGSKNWLRLQPLLDVFFGLTFSDFRWCFLAPFIHLKRKGDNTIKSFCDDIFGKEPKQAGGYVNDLKNLARIIRAYQSSNSGNGNYIGRDIKLVKEIINGLTKLEREDYQEHYIYWLSKVITYIFKGDEKGFLECYNSLMRQLQQNFPQYNYYTSLKNKKENMVKALYTLIVCCVVSAGNDGDMNVQDGMIRKLLLPNTGLMGVYDKSDRRIEDYMLEYIAICEHYPINTIERLEELSQPKYTENIYVQSELVRLYAMGAKLSNVDGTESYYLEANAEKARQCWETKTVNKYSNSSLSLYLFAKNNNWEVTNIQAAKFHNTPLRRLKRLKEEFHGGEYDVQQLWRELEKLQDEMPFSLEIVLLMVEVILQYKKERQATNDIVDKWCTQVLQYIETHRIDWTMHPRGYDFILMVDEKSLKEAEILRGAKIGSRECIWNLLCTHNSKADEVIYHYLVSEQAENQQKYHIKFLEQLIDYYISQGESKKSIYYKNIIRKLDELWDKASIEFQKQKAENLNDLSDEEFDEIQKKERYFRSKSIALKKRL